MSPYRGSALVVCRAAPRAPWWRVAWAQLARGVLTRLLRARHRRARSFEHRCWRASLGLEAGACAHAWMVTSRVLMGGEGPDDAGWEIVCDACGARRWQYCDRTFSDWVMGGSLYLEAKLAEQRPVCRRRGRGICHGGCRCSGALKATTSGGGPG